MVGGSSSSKSPGDATDGADANTDAPIVQTRAPHTRNTRKFIDTAPGPEHRSDWSRFEIGAVLRTLKLAQNEATIDRELRKLHLRWWHASKTSTTKVLTAAGLPKEVIEMIPGIVDTCKECRKWQKPPPETIATYKMTTKFNEHVEFDLMFYKSFTIFHGVDRASRWHAAKIIEDKEDGTLLEAIMTTWVGIHGPMTQLIIDGESDIAHSEYCEKELKARGIDLKIRAPQQHARYIERRGALLRATLHSTEEQLKREGVATPIGVLLAEAVYAGNCLTFVGGVTPYQVVYGRQPAILPPLAIDDEDIDKDSAGNGRVEARVREIALQEMIEATSQARINRALKTKTRLPGEARFTVGDVVEYYRPPSSKDISGWLGPATITEVVAIDGQVQIEHKGRKLRCRLQDVRQFIGLGLVYEEFAFSNEMEQWNY